MAGRSLQTGMPCGRPRAASWVYSLSIACLCRLRHGSSSGQPHQQFGCVGGGGGGDGRQNNSQLEKDARINRSNDRTDDRRTNRRNSDCTIRCHNHHGNVGGTRHLRPARRVHLLPRTRVVSCIISPRSSLPNKRTRFRCHPLHKIRFASPPALSSHPVIPLFPIRHPFLAMATKRLGVAKTESNGREAADAKSALLKLIEWASQMNMYGTTSQLHTRGSFSSSLALLLSLPLSASLTRLYISSHSSHLVPSLTNVLSSCVFVMCVWSC